MKLMRPSGSPLMPAGPDRLVGSEPPPMMSASGKRNPERPAEKSDIAAARAGFYNGNGRTGGSGVLEVSWSGAGSCATTAADS